MKKTTFLAALSFACLCFAPLAGRGQEGGSSGVTGYTEIDYDEATNTVSADSETDLDYNVAGDYTAGVALIVRKEDGSVVGYADEQDYDIAVAYVEFAGEPETTYTAIGTHKLYAAQSFNEYPCMIEGYCGTYYWDSFNFGYFESQNIESPWQYYFRNLLGSPVSRRMQRINLGTTYDEDSVTTPPSSDSDIEWIDVSDDQDIHKAEFLGGFNVATLSTDTCGYTRFPIKVRFKLRQLRGEILDVDAHTSPDGMFQLVSAPGGSDAYLIYYKEARPPFAIAYLRKVRDTGLSNVVFTVTGKRDNGQTFNSPASVRIKCISR